MKISFDTDLARNGQTESSFSISLTLPLFDLVIVYIFHLFTFLPWFKWNIE